MFQILARAMKKKKRENEPKCDLEARKGGREVRGTKSAH